MGLKLHLITNEQGQLLAAKFIPGNVDDRTPVPNRVKNLKGLLFGDRGYIKQELFESLYQRGLKLVTSLKKTIKPKLMTWWDKVMLRKRGVIESIFNVLKNGFELEHTRHRRAGIEPLIGHLKRGWQMGKTRLKTDRTGLSSAYGSVLGFNLRQLMRNQEAIGN